MEAVQSHSTSCVALPIIIHSLIPLHFLSRTLLDELSLSLYPVILPPSAAATPRLALTRSSTPISAPALSLLLPLVSVPPLFLKHSLALSHPLPLSSVASPPLLKHSLPLSLLGSLSLLAILLFLHQPSLSTRTRLHSRTSSIPISVFFPFTTLTLEHSFTPSLPYQNSFTRWLHPDRPPLFLPFTSHAIKHSLPHSMHSLPHSFILSHRLSTPTIFVSFTLTHTHFPAFSLTHAHYHPHHHHHRLATPSTMSSLPPHQNTPAPLTEPRSSQEPARSACHLPLG